MKKNTPIGYMNHHIRFVMNRAIPCVVLFIAISIELNAQTILPLPTITKSVFAMSKQLVQWNTASATGNSTFCNGLVSISSTGIITGNGTFETYSSSGTKLSTVNVTILSGSQVSSTTSNLTAINVNTVDYGYSSGGEKIRAADYFADVIVKFSNGFIARGKCAYRYRYVYQNSGGEVFNYDDSGTGFKLSITGPGGHIGFVNTGSLNN
jgi:hypothetical protein